MENADNSISNNGFKLIMQYRNVIMGIATLWIYIFHAWIPIFNNPTGNITLFCHYIEEYIRKMGYCGVDIFLLLSGMGLTYAIKKGSLARFYYRRIRRVFIPYLVTDFQIRWCEPEYSVGLGLYSKMSQKQDEERQQESFHNGKMEVVKGITVSIKAAKI